MVNHLANVVVGMNYKMKTGGIKTKTPCCPPIDDLSRDGIFGEDGPHN